MKKTRMMLFLLLALSLSLFAVACNDDDDSSGSAGAEGQTCRGYENYCSPACDFAKNEYCKNNECVAGTACDEECDFANNEYCDLSQGVCITADEDAQALDPCDTGLECNWDTGICESVGGGDNNDDNNDDGGDDKNDDGGDATPQECTEDGELGFGGKIKEGCDTKVGVCETAEMVGPQEWYPCVSDPDCCCDESVAFVEGEIFGCEFDSCGEDGYCDPLCEGIEWPDPDCE